MSDREPDWDEINGIIADEQDNAPPTEPFYSFFEDDDDEDVDWEYWDDDDCCADCGEPYDYCVCCDEDDEAAAGAPLSEE